MGAGRVACDLLHSDGDAAHPITGIAREALQAHSGPAGAFTALGSVRPPFHPGTAEAASDFALATTQDGLFHTLPDTPARPIRRKFPAISKKI